MSDNVYSISPVEPEESIVLKYFSLPEGERNEKLISALEEETRKLVSAIEKDYDGDLTIAEIDNLIIAYYKHQHYDYFIRSLSRIGIMSAQDNDKRLCFQKRITEAKQHSSFYRAINDFRDTQSLSDMQQVVVKDFKDEMLKEGNELDHEQQKQLTKLKTEISILEIALDGKAPFDTDDYSKLKELIKKRRDLALLLGYANFAAMELSSREYYYNNPEELKELLTRLCDARADIDESYLTETIPNVSLGELESRVLEYAGELMGLEPVKVNGDFGNGIQIFEIKKDGQRFAWISYFETDKYPAGATCPMRRFRNIGDGENIPDILVSIMKPEDDEVSMQHIKTVLHEMGHCLLFILAHKCYPNCNMYVSPDAQEFYSILFEGLLQDFLERKFGMRFEERLPLRDSADNDNVENSLSLIDLHRATTDEEIDRQIEIWQEENKFINLVAKPGYAVNKHSYIIGAALAEAWINHFYKENRDNYVECLMKWFADLCEKGTLAKADDLFDILEKNPTINAINGTVL